jgi:hypothetical protein
MEQKFR